MPLLCVASPKGGVGKTSIVAGLADALKRAGRTVVAIDSDPQNALRLHLGLPITDGAGYLARLPDRPDWRACLRRTPAGIDLLPHGETDMRGALASAAMLEREPDLLAGPVRAMLADPATIVVADTPPGASVALSILQPQAALVLAVLLADAASTALLPDIESGRFLGQGTLGTLNGPKLLVALNQVDRGSRLSIAAAEGVAAHLGPRLAGAVCRDDAVAEALACQQPIGAHAPGSQPARDIADLAAALLRHLPPPAVAPVASPLFPWMRQ
ncbi:AAA family ATPase [Roseomonas eburnea]|uniref:AAA family ATPase n=1 Tax=Neoroseomonas eburnea TaxID=1346889 RepID=A0A9X9XK50_9PROT|nr:cellulose synthase operon protein YhjQ/BcsQ [Neoroseomonas eburnea]MBR0684086.1 AAA family ATPase [Neoroseomonas eburnea]